MKIRNQLLCFLLVIATAQIAHSQTPVSLNGKLKLVGNQLSSECGNPVQLRGMSSQGLQWYGDCLTKSALTSLRNNWNADIVRLAMYIDVADGGYLSDTAYWQGRINTLVDQIGALGMYCIIDWHVLTPGDPNYYLQDAIYFWRYMSKQNAGKKHVLYEICNEPNGVTWPTIKNYANQIIPVIRANDPETVIIVGTPNYSGLPGDVVSGGPLTGANAYNALYTIHFYAASNASYRPQVQAAAGSIPIFCSEWGLSQSSGDGTLDTTEGHLWMNILAGNNTGNQLISWCNWSFSDKAESSAALTDSSCTNDTWTSTTISGTQVKIWMSDPAQSFTSCGSCTSPSLGGYSQSLCGTSGSLTLNSGLSAINKTFTWTRNGTTLSNTLPTLTVSTGGTYTVTVDSLGCIRSDQTVVVDSISTVNLGAVTDFCSSTSITLDADVSGAGVSYEWTYNSQIQTDTARTLTVTQPGTYSVTASASSCASQTGQITITSSLPIVTNDTLCVPGGKATLVATGAVPFNWYNSPNSGSILFTGTTYTPSVNSSTTYYIQAALGQSYTMGPANKGASYWTLLTTDYPTNDKQLAIIPLANVTLKSLDVDASPGAQSVTINITDAATSTIIKTVTQTVPAAQVTINVGANLSSGREYRIDAIGTTGSLYFINGPNTLWPQTTANVATIQENDGVTWASMWSTFYNIVLTLGNSCMYTPVTATVEVCTGLESDMYSSNVVVVFPNPFENNFTLSLSTYASQVQRIELSNVQGVLLDSRQGMSISPDMTLGDNLAPGQYIVRIIGTNGVVVKPVMKMK